MAQIKWGDKTIEIEGSFTVDGKAVPAAGFIGRMLTELEALRTTVPKVSGTSGGSVPCNSASSGATSTNGMSSASSSPSAIPTNSSTPVTSPTTMTALSGSMIKCPECEGEVDSSFFCSDQNLCGECMDTNECDMCSIASTCTVIAQLNSQNTSASAALKAAIRNSSFSPNPVVTPVGHAPSGTAIQPAKPSVIPARAGDEFGW